MGCALPGRNGTRRSFTIGKKSKITKAAAEAKLAELVASVNAKGSSDPNVAEFVASAYRPFKRRGWKASTRGTTEQRLRTHIVADLGGRRISELRREMMSEYLEQKAGKGKSHSLVAHLRWDLKAILDLAVADGIVPTNQAADLFVPRVKRIVSKATATPNKRSRRWQPSISGIG